MDDDRREDPARDPGAARRDPDPGPAEDRGTVADRGLPEHQRGAGNAVPDRPASGNGCPFTEALDPLRATRSGTGRRGTIIPARILVSDRVRKVTIILACYPFRNGYERRKRGGTKRGSELRKAGSERRLQRNEGQKGTEDAQRDCMTAPCASGITAFPPASEPASPSCWPGP